jgi:hypothetical protein
MTMSKQDYEKLLDTKSFYTKSEHSFLEGIYIRIDDE